MSDNSHTLKETTMKRYKGYGIEKSTIKTYGKWMVKLYPVAGGRFETLFAPTKAQAQEGADMFMRIRNN